MLSAKLKFKIGHLLARIRNVNINWGRVLADIFFIIIILALGINIYITFDKGLSTMERFNEEQEKLNAILGEHEELTEQVKEYESLEYKRIYARDNLNLGHDNETIYYIERQGDPLDIEPLEEDKMRIDFKDKKAYWLELLF
jgi:cell division protein FtsB